MDWFWKRITDKGIDRILGVYIAILLYFGWTNPAFAFFTAIFTVFKALTIIQKVLLVVGVVAGFAAAKKAKKKRQQALERALAGIGGVLVNKAGTTEPIPVVYGERVVGGVRTFIDNQNKSGSNKNDYLHLVLTMAEGPVEGIKEVYFNDELVATSTDQTGCLLYTSPSPRDGLLSRMPSSA